jgi:hypothetical protein
MSQAPIPPASPQPDSQPTLEPPPLQAAPGNPYVEQPPLVQTIPYYTPSTGQQAGGVWNRGRILVMHKQAQLPPQCVKCGAPAEGPMLKRRLTWHSPWLYLLLVFMLPGLVLLAIVAMCVQERATIHIGLCARHRRSRRINLAITFAMFFAAIVMAVITANIRDRDLRPVLTWIAVLLAIAAPIYGLLACRMVVATKMDQQYVWLKGVSKVFAGQFPALPQ